MMVEFFSADMELSVWKTKEESSQSGQEKNQTKVPKRTCCGMAVAAAQQPPRPPDG